MFRHSGALRGSGMVWAAVLCCAASGRADLHLGAERLVQAGGQNVAVPGYSVPSFADWNGDGVPDLIVGEGGGTIPGKVRVYVNVGTADAPQFNNDSFYAQANGADLFVPASGCLGAFPRLVDWNDDNLKDLLIGQADGKIKIFLNIGTAEAPTFDGGAFMQVGQPGLKTDIALGARATPNVLDWNSDGLKDLVSGEYDGRIAIFLNVGTNASPDFRAVAYAQSSGADLRVSSNRSSPCVEDFDEDGRKDVVTGNTNGELWFYANVGTDAAPSFAGGTRVTAAGVAIDLAGTPRSRPFVCDWNADGKTDVLIGAGDGLVHLYEGHCPADVNHDGQAGLTDLALLLAAYGSAMGEPEYDAMLDFDGDGDVDILDLASLLANYGCWGEV